MAAPSLVKSVGAASGSASTSGSLTLASAPTVGNLLLFVMAGDKDTGALTLPAGWTVELNSRNVGSSLYAAWKVSNGTETTTSFSWATAAGSGNTSWIGEYSQAGAGAWGVGTKIVASFATGATSYASGSTPANTLPDTIAVSMAAVDSNTSIATANSSFTNFTKFYEGAPTGSSPVLVLGSKPSITGDVLSTTFSFGTGGVADEGNVGILAVGRSAATPVPSLDSRVVGISDPTAVRVRVRTTNATSVRLKVGTNAAVTTGVVFGPAVTPDAQGGALLTATGLASGTQYFYRVAMTDSASAETVDALATVGQVKTAPVGQTSFAFDFGSCCSTSDSPSLAAIAARTDDLFFHLGDLYYDDGNGTSLANFRAHMDAKITATNHAAVLATRASSYTPSDHDGMQADVFGGADPTAWANWNTAYRERFAPPTLPASGVYFTFVWGRVRFIQLDCSTFQSGSTTVLGATQKQWLKDTITAATEPLLVIIQSMPWIGADGDGDTWGYQAAERSELASFFVASGKRIAMLAGDMHAVAADDGTHSPGGIAVFQAAPFAMTASVKGGPYSAGPYPASGSAFVNQYGRCVVTDDGSTITLAFTGYSSDNTARVALTRTFATTAAPARVTDRWNGTALVRQRVDRWTGTALAQQVVGT